MKVRANTGRECRDAYFEGGVSAWRINSSVGIGGRNQRDDVRKIQKLLNLIMPQDGGPVVPLVDDGWIGPKTNQAILHFQRFQRTGSDGRVDPYGPTLKRMNEVVKPRLATNNAYLLARVASVMGELTQMTTKARNMIDRAMNYLIVGDGMFAKKRDYEMADLYFDFSKLSEAGARADLALIKTTFNRARTVLLKRPSPVTGGNPLGVSIFTIDPLGHDHMAYVPTHRPVEQRSHPDVHPGHVYLCQKIGTTSRGQVHTHLDA